MADTRDVIVIGYLVGAVEGGRFAPYEELFFHPQAKRWAALLARIRRRA